MEDSSSVAVVSTPSSCFQSEEGSNQSNQKRIKLRGGYGVLLCVTFLALRHTK